MAVDRHHSTADAALESMGYKSEMPRHLSIFSIMGMSFGIMAVPLGIAAGFYIALTDGQAVTMLWGWVFVSIISLFIAASLAEICAVFPTAGGVYYWSAMISTRKWAPITSWVCGWLNLVGNWCILLAINFSFAQIILGAINLWDTTWWPQAWHSVLMFFATTLLSFCINVFLSKHLNLLNTICIWWTAASMLVFVIVLSAYAKAGRHSASWVFGHFDASESGWPDGWAWFVGLLQAAYTLTGYGMVASMCEEVENPEREVPKAIVLSVAAADLTGIIWLLPVLFTLPDIKLILSVPTDQPVGLIFKEVTGSAGGGFALLILIFGIAIFAGAGAMTASSRAVYAFARDGGIPGSHLWSKIDSRFNVPLWGLVLTMAVNDVLACIYFGSSAAFNAFVGVGTICLSAAYGVPILASMVRGRRLMQGSAFPLGKFGFAINAVSVVWICFALVLFCFPVANHPTADTMNYASAVFAGFAGVSILWYFVKGRKHFSGPPVREGHDGEVVRVTSRQVSNVSSDAATSEGGMVNEKEKEAEAGNI